MSRRAAGGKSDLLTSPPVRPITIYITCYGFADADRYPARPRARLPWQPAEAAGRADAGRRGADPRRGRAEAAAGAGAAARGAGAGADDRGATGRGGGLQPAGRYPRR